jgi:hypothetical protein
MLAMVNYRGGKCRPRARDLQMCNWTSTKYVCHNHDKIWKPLRDAMSVKSTGLASTSVIEGRIASMMIFWWLSLAPDMRRASRPALDVLDFVSRNPVTHW